MSSRWKCVNCLIVREMGVQLLGDELADKIRIYAGDIVPKKKPDPAIYNLAAQELGVEPHK